MKVILDTNVWVSAWLWAGLPAKIVMLNRSRSITIYASQALLNEIEGTLRKEKFRDKIRQLQSSVEEIVLKTQRQVELCPTISIEVPQLRDRNDTIVLAAAVAAQAEVVVTGDRDLLVLNPFSDISILTPQGFLDIYFPNL